MTAFEYSRTKPEIWPESNCALATVAVDSINNATAVESSIARLIEKRMGGNLENESMRASCWLEKYRGYCGRARPQRLLEKVIALIAMRDVELYNEFIFFCQETW